MTTTLELPATATIVTTTRPPGVWRKVVDVATLTYRNLVHIAREPLQLSDVTVQPILFTLLFVYVFGASVVIPHGGSYAKYAIAGMIALNLTTSAMGTAVGLSNDLNSGIIDRFRTLPMWRPAVLVGRSMTDLFTAMICTGFVAGTGLPRRMAARARFLLRPRRLRHLLAVQLRRVVGLRVPRHHLERSRVGPGRRTRHLVPARHCLECARAHGAHARGASGLRQLESRSAP